MGQNSSLENTNQDTPSWPDLSYEEMFINQLNLCPLKTINSKLNTGLPILSLYASDKEVYIFVYKGESKWHIRIANNGSGGGDDVVNGDEFHPSERNEFIFTEIMEYYKNLDFRNIVSQALRAFELFENFAKANFEGENKNKKIEEYLKVKQLLLEKSFNFVKDNF